MEELIPQHGNYKKLISYQKSNVIYCLTYYFVQNYLDKKDRTCDQMIQAARSGKQNIIEGSAASTTSAKTEIKLVNVAKASLQELLEDYSLTRPTRSRTHRATAKRRWRNALISRRLRWSAPATCTSATRTTRASSRGRWATSRATGCATRPPTTGTWK